MSVKLFKNLFQTIATLIAIVFVDTILLSLYIVTSFKEQPNYGWILLVVAGGLLLVCFLGGFYWIFQKVIIDKDGVKVVFFNKVISKYSFDDIDYYAFTNHRRNPSITFKMKDEKLLHIDRRKKALDCLKHYKVKEETKPNPYVL